MPDGLGVSISENADHWDLQTLEFAQYDQKQKQKKYIVSGCSVGRNVLDKLV